jgi:hypothetical protein
MWRVLIGFGAVPACIALYYRLTIPETPRYTFDVARDVEKVNDDVEAYMAGKASGDSVDEVARAKGRKLTNSSAYYGVSLNTVANLFLCPIPRAPYSISREHVSCSRLSPGSLSPKETYYQFVIAHYPHNYRLQWRTYRVQAADEYRRRKLDRCPGWRNSWVLGNSCYS